MVDFFELVSKAGNLRCKIDLTGFSRSKIYGVMEKISQSRKKVNEIAGAGFIASSLINKNLAKNGQEIRTAELT